MAPGLIGLILAAQITTSTVPLDRARDLAATWEMRANVERAEKYKARAALAQCTEELAEARQMATTPIVRTVEIEVMPAWGWALIVGAAGVAVGAGVTAYVIGSRQ